MALRIGEILVEKRIIAPEDLSRALAEQQRTGEVLGQVLIKMGFISERQLLQVLAEQLGIPFVELKEVKIHDNAIKNVPAKLAWHYKVMPLSIEGNVLTIAISNPSDMWPIDDLETNLGYRVEKVLASSSDILEAINKFYGIGADTIERILEGDKYEQPGAGEAVENEKVEDLEKMAGDASVIKLVNQILHEAIKDRTTDIHMEHFRNEVTLRYRIDGILYDRQLSGNIGYLYPAIISRIKVISNLDIVERRIPQDGRAKVKIGNSEYELRVSVIPTLYGENIVIRILPTAMLFSLSELGIPEKALDTIAQLIQKSHGIIFTTGPTGSGKTTTLYACLNKLNTRQRKIVTIEDPIEYELKGVCQSQINPKIDLTFGKMLRSMLRHDPDVMMVGEVRDFETAEITIQTALTGHLVFSTLHTNDAASGITRLLNIGIEPYLITSSVEAFIAQRLVRVICPKCKEKVSLRGREAAEAISEIASLSSVFAKASADKSVARNDKAKDAVVYRGKGCKACNNTGYRGRTGIYEILLVGDEIRKLILQKASSEEIKAKACELGMLPLRQDGWERVLAGITTLEEVIRVTQA